MTSEKPFAGRAVTSSSGPWRIVHMTSVHLWHDTRVFRRMCRSLAQRGHQVHLVAPCADRTEMEIHDGVQLHPISPARGRLGRAWITSRQVCKRALQLRADIYHFHDPELIPHALWMAARGHCVIYDAHEDLPKDLLDKHWLKPPFHYALVKPLDWLERLAGARLAAVVAAEEEIEARFRRPGRETVTIHNYPALEDFPATARPPVSDPAGYVVAFGGLSRLRAIEPVVQAFGLLPADRPARLILSGRCESPQLLESLRGMPGFRQRTTGDGSAMRKCVSCWRGRPLR